MSTEATAAMVAAADPDRFRAAMAAPKRARPTLFAIYAFNLEVARAPWVASESLIAEMRLQWWRDALAEIAAGGPVRRHEVTTPLSEILPAGAVPILEQVIDARRRDISNEPFHNVTSLTDYIDQTAGSLMWAAVRALGAADEPEVEDIVRDTGRAIGLVRYFAAVPALIARGRRPLPEGMRIDALAQTTLGDLPDRAMLKGALPMPARAATFDAAGAAHALARIARRPDSVQAGRAGLSATRRRIALLRRAWGV